MEEYIKVEDMTVREYNNKLYEIFDECEQEFQTPEFKKKMRTTTLAPNSLAQELAVNNMIFDVLFGGAVGGGKSFVILLRIAFMINICRKIAEERSKRNLHSTPASFLIVRKELPGLKDLIKNSYLFFSGMGEFKVADKMWKLRDGIEITFGFIRDEKSFTKFQGLEYTGIYIDEAGQYSTQEFENIELLKSRLRNTAGYPSDLLLTANPGDKGHNYLVKNYNVGTGQKARINKFYKGELIGPDHECYSLTANEDPQMKSNAFIPSSSADNPAIDSKYIDRLRNSAMPKFMKDALIDGLWIVKAGGMFEDIFDENVHVLDINKTEIPKGWRFTRGYDWGSASPYASVIFAENNGNGHLRIDGKDFPTPIGTKIVVDEEYSLMNGEADKGDRSTVVEHAQRLNKLEEEVKQRYGINRIEAGYADNQIFTGEQGDTTADKFKRFGLDFMPCQKGAGSRAVGWMNIRTMFKNTIDHEKEPDVDPRKPCLYYMNVCEHAIRTTKEVQRNVKTNDGDLEKSAEDHILDVIRYNTTKVIRKKTKSKRLSRGL